MDFASRRVSKHRGWPSWTGWRASTAPSARWGRSRRRLAALYKHESAAGVVLRALGGEGVPRGVRFDAQHPRGGRALTSRRDVPGLAFRERTGADDGGVAYEPAAEPAVSDPRLPRAPTWSSSPRCGTRRSTSALSGNVVACASRFTRWTHGTCVEVLHAARRGRRALHDHGVPPRRRQVPRRRRGPARAGPPSAALVLGVSREVEKWDGADVWRDEQKPPSRASAANPGPTRSFPSAKTHLRGVREAFARFAKQRRGPIRGVPNRSGRVLRASRLQEPRRVAARGGAWLGSRRRAEMDPRQCPGVRSIRADLKTKSWAFSSPFLLMRLSPFSFYPPCLRHLRPAPSRLLTSLPSCRTRALYRRRRERARHAAGGERDSRHLKGGVAGGDGAVDDGLERDGTSTSPE